MDDLHNLIESMRTRSEIERVLIASIIDLRTAVSGKKLELLGTDVRKTFANMVRELGAQIEGTHH